MINRGCFQRGSGRIVSSLQCGVCVVGDGMGRRGRTDLLEEHEHPDRLVRGLANGETVILLTPPLHAY